MSPTMTPETVYETLQRRGTRIVTVIFYKKDGSLRTINGVLRAAKHMVGGDRGAAQSEVLRNHNLVPIYSFRDKGWRSFSVDHVVEIR